MPLSFSIMILFYFEKKMPHKVICFADDDVLTKRAPVSVLVAL